MKKLQITFLTAIFVFGAYAGNSKGDVAKVINYKKVVSQIEYPQVCKEKGIEGKVIVRINIDESGKVTDYEFITYPCTDLRDAVENAISKLQFNPGTNDKGEPIKGKLILPVNFKLTI